MPTDPRPLTAEEEAKFRRVHRQYSDLCDTCRLLATLDAERAARVAAETALGECRTHRSNRERDLLTENSRLRVLVEDCPQCRVLAAARAAEEERR